MSICYYEARTLDVAVPEPDPADRTRTKTVTPETDGLGQVAAPTVAWVFPRGSLVTRPTPQAHRVGRGDDCSTQLPGQTISWHHAEFRLLDGALHLKDLGSRNGTRVNGRTITEPTFLKPGDVVRCGEWLGCVVNLSSSDHAFGVIAPNLVGGASLAATLDPARRVAPKGLPIVLEGATGTGKERAAVAIHGWSGRDGEFVGVNCAAIPSDLAEAELFGHTKGAYSGADRARPGYLRQAHRGTLLLDEFAELPLPIQAKLLRALQEREVRPVGATIGHKIDVLIVAAAQTPIHDLVEKGLLREDLAARLYGLTLRLPTLEERREDIAPLFSYFLEKHNPGTPPQIDANLMESLLLRQWPHNVRGLENLAKTLSALHGHEPTLSLKHLPESERYQGLAAESEDEREMLFHRIGRMLEEHNGNVSRTAAALGLDRSKVRRILRRYSDQGVKAK